MSCIAKWRNVKCERQYEGGGDGICSACLHNWVQSIWTLIIGRITSEGEGWIHMRSEVKTYNILVQSPATQSLYLHCTAFHIYPCAALCEIPMPGWRFHVRTFVHLSWSCHVRRILYAVIEKEISLVCYARLAFCCHNSNAMSLSLRLWIVAVVNFDGFLTLYSCG